MNIKEAATLLLLPCLAAAAGSDLLPPNRRQPTVELARSLAEPSRLSDLPTDLRTPFNPPGFDQPDPDEKPPAPPPEAPKLPSTDREILNLIAEKLAPTGTFVMGGETILLIGKTKVKIGATLPVSYEGRTLAVQVTYIDRTSYSLRLNRSEITRAILPGKKP
jgi:hypothetical protein